MQDSKNSKVVYIHNVSISNPWLKFHDKLIHNAKFLANLLHSVEYEKPLFSQKLIYKPVGISLLVGF